MNNIINLRNFTFVSQTLTSASPGVTSPMFNVRARVQVDKLNHLSDVLKNLHVAQTLK